MKVNELQPGHYYACYKTWPDEVDKDIVLLVHFYDKEWVEDWKFYKIQGFIIECSPKSIGATREFIKAYAKQGFIETEFKEITEEQFNDIRAKYTIMYNTVQKLME